MHDPMTQAFEIKYPWWKHKPWPKKHQHSRSRKFTWDNLLTEAQRVGRDSFWDTGYRDTFITIWHLDPERDGSDDSCGWSFPKLTPWQKSRLWNGAWSEASNPHFLAFNGRHWEGNLSDAVSMYTALVIMVARLLDLEHKVTIDRAQRMALERIHWPDCCKGTDVFCFQPGYHTNSPKDKEDDRQEHFHGILCGISRRLLSDLRPWYRHPKWHFWHWRLQIHPIQNLVRRYWTKCCKCGRRGFKEAAITDWNHTKVWHQSCEGVSLPTSTTTEQTL